MLHSIIVVFNGLLDLVAGVFRVFQTPGSGVTLGTQRIMVGLRTMMRSMVRVWIVWKRKDWDMMRGS